ncbi:MAG: glycosyltransferase, partial [Anaerolineae bacterium]|nr:glycosyltransferase [Anaerolineae bacterium]
ARTQTSHAHRARPAVLAGAALWPEGDLMRIGLVTGEYPPMQGGVGAYTAILARELTQIGHEIALFSTRTARSDMIPLTQPFDGWGIRSLPAVKQWASDYHLDLINLQFQTAAFAMSPWIHVLPDYMRGVPVATTFHDLRFPYLFPKAGPLREAIVMHLARASSGLIVTNHEDEMRIRHLPYHRLIPIGSNILETLPDDFDPTPWRSQAGANEGDFLLAYFGLINRSKGIETLLESMAALRTEKISVRLLLIGGVAGTSDPTNVAYAAEIDQRIDSLELRPFVHQTGYLADEREVGSYLRASDAIVLPFQDGASFRRGSLMAAIHYACAIVTTLPRVHVPEFVHTDNMLLVAPDDPDVLQHSLRLLHQSTVLRDQLRRGASQLAARFDWKQIAQDYVDFFEQIVEGRA